MLFSATFVAPWHIGASDVADVATFAPLSSAEGLVNAREYAVRPNETRSSARGADDVVAQARPCPVNPFSPPRWVHPGIGMVLKAFGGICPARVPARLDKGHATREGSYFLVMGATAVIYLRRWQHVCHVCPPYPRIAQDACALDNVGRFWRKGSWKMEATDPWGNSLFPESRRAAASNVVRVDR